MFFASKSLTNCSVCFFQINLLRSRLVILFRLSFLRPVLGRQLGRLQLFWTRAQSWQEKAGAGAGAEAEVDLEAEVKVGRVIAVEADVEGLYKERLSF